MLSQATKFGQSTWEEVKHLCRRPRETCHTVLSLCCVILAGMKSFYVYINVQHKRAWPADTVAHQWGASYSLLPVSNRVRKRKYK